MCSLAKRLNQDAIAKLRHVPPNTLWACLFFWLGHFSCAATGLQALVHGAKRLEVFSGLVTRAGAVVADVAVGLFHSGHACSRRGGRGNYGLGRNGWGWGWRGSRGRSCSGRSSGCRRRSSSFSRWHSALHSLCRSLCCGLFGLGGHLRGGGHGGRGHGLCKGCHRSSDQCGSNQGIFKHIFPNKRNNIATFL